MTHEPLCTEIPCTCVSILRDRISIHKAVLISYEKELSRLQLLTHSLENKIKDGLSCCCAGCTKHNLQIQSPDSTDLVEV